MQFLQVWKILITLLGPRVLRGEEQQKPRPRLQLFRTGHGEVLQGLTLHLKLGFRAYFDIFCTIRNGFGLRTHGCESHFLIEPYPQWMMIGGGKAGKDAAMGAGICCMAMLWFTIGVCWLRLLISSRFLSCLLPQHFFNHLKTMIRHIKAMMYVITDCAVRGAPICSLDKFKSPMFVFEFS